MRIALNILETSDKREDVLKCIMQRALPETPEIVLEVIFS